MTITQTIKDYAKIAVVAAYLGLTPAYAQSTQPLEQRIKDKQEQYESKIKTEAKKYQEQIDKYLQKGDSLLAEALKDKYFDWGEQKNVLEEYSKAKDLEEKIDEKYAKDMLNIDKEHEALIKSIDNNTNFKPNELKNYLKKYETKAEDYKDMQNSLHKFALGFLVLFFGGIYVAKIADNWNN